MLVYIDVSKVAEHKINWYDEVISCCSFMWSTVSMFHLILYLHGSNNGYMAQIYVYMDTVTKFRPRLIYFMYKLYIGLFP